MFAAPLFFVTAAVSAIETHAAPKIHAVALMAFATKAHVGPSQASLEAATSAASTVRQPDEGLAVVGAGVDSVNQQYSARSPTDIPAGFTSTCNEMGWASEQMWVQLSDGHRPWFEAANGAYIYWNRSDGCWWIDAPSGAGLYILKASTALPPLDGSAGEWEPLTAEAAAGLPDLVAASSLR